MQLEALNNWRHSTTGGTQQHIKKIQSNQTKSIKRFINYLMLETRQILKFYMSPTLKKENMDAT